MVNIYLVRHAEVLRVNNKNSSDNLQLQNEKRILSVEGEQHASELFSNIKVPFIITCLVIVLIILITIYFVSKEVEK